MADFTLPAEAIEAVRIDRPRRYECDCETCMGVMRDDLTAALPHIVKAVREQVAQELPAIYAEHGHRDDWGVQVIYLDSLQRVVREAALRVER